MRHSIPIAIVSLAILVFTSAIPEANNFPKVGEKAPDVVLKNPAGEMMSLSSLKGKVVLLDFWASWCGPCRKDNPNLVAAYNKYRHAKMKNADGFEIFSVSLDKNPNAWKSAIVKDKLSWEYHVSDLSGWNSAAAKTYGIHAIPQNVLIDANGIIVVKNLRGKQLEAALDQLVVK